MAGELEVRDHLKDYRTAETGWDDIFREALEDLLFVSGEGQWPEEIKADRENNNRPVLYFNMMWKFIKSIVGDQKQNRPQIKVYPVDSKADVNTAEIFQDIIRHIEYRSNAHAVYDTGFHQQLSSSIGYWRVVSEYKEGSFEQELKIEKIRNNLSVLYDPRAKDPLFLDAEYVFLQWWMPKEDYVAQYPDASTGSFPNTSYTDADEGWFEEDRIRVAEKYYKTKKTYTILLLNTGDTVALTDGVTREMVDELAEEQGYEIVDERETEKTEIYWVLMNGGEILEGPTLHPGKFLPVVPVLGDEMDIQGRLRLFSLIRHAKDAQRMYNYWNTTMTETVALQPRAPYIGTPANFAGFEEDWRRAPSENPAYLLANPDPQLGGAMPNRQPPPTVPTGAAQMTAKANDDIYNTIGLTPPALGEQSNERSGKALAMRQRSADKSVFSFYDNHSAAIAHTGRILVDLIPYYYDREQVINIMGDDDNIKQIVINKTQLNMEMLQEEVINDLTDAGEYDVVLSSGPSYETKRHEISEFLMQVVQFAPDTAPIVVPELLKNLDAPGAQDMAEKLHRLMPPEMQAALTGDTQAVPGQGPGMMAAPTPAPGV